MQYPPANEKKAKKNCEKMEIEPPKKIRNSVEPTTSNGEICVAWVVNSKVRVLHQDLSVTKKQVESCRQQDGTTGQLDATRGKDFTNKNADDQTEWWNRTSQRRPAGSSLISSAVPPAHRKAILRGRRVNSSPFYLLQSLCGSSGNLTEPLNMVRL